MGAFARTADPLARVFMSCLVEAGGAVGRLAEEGARSPVVQALGGILILAGVALVRVDEIQATRISPDRGRHTPEPALAGRHK
jgi:hypothetical protein